MALCRGGLPCAPPWPLPTLFQSHPPTPTAAVTPAMVSRVPAGKGRAGLQWRTAVRSRKSDDDPRNPWSHVTRKWPASLTRSVPACPLPSSLTTSPVIVTSCWPLCYCSKICQIHLCLRAFALAILAVPCGFLVSVDKFTFSGRPSFLLSPSPSRSLPSSLPPRLVVLSGVRSGRAGPLPPLHAQVLSTWQWCSVNGRMPSILLPAASPDTRLLCSAHA